MTLRQRLIIVLAILAVATVVANGFSFYMYSGLASDLLKIEPRLASSLQQSRLLIVVVVSLASAVGLAAFVLLIRILLGLLGGEPQYAADVVKRIATGDLAFAVKLREGDRSSLLAGISGMQQKLREMVAQLRAASAQLGQTAAQFSGTTGEIRVSTEAQSEAAAGSAAAVEEMSVSIRSVADSAAEVDRQSAESLAGTQEGNESLSRMIGEIGEVEQTVNEIATTAGAFIESTQAINRMTREVRDIADQTNLLALNAAIEAARAGEQGRGFAVVADEVRKLAEKSAVAAREIDNVTHSLGEKSGQVEVAIGRGNAALAASQEYLERVAEVLGMVGSKVSAAHQGMTAISASAQEQTTASNDIAGNIERIARMAEENIASVHRAVAQAEQLEALAATLSELAGRFTV
ncbi:methyl-accepting chemotaxis protein McpA [mine drainage metagenome]|uniref:Methyl-accepting chemotaxis protein McpA n=1 Tax=mine drainage metagenome TaxID=410659 RepID=A0A1J5S6A0_9ZZZZ